LHAATEYSDGHNEESAFRCRLTEKKSKKIEKFEVETMWDTCAVELRVQLPKSLAAEVEQVQRTDPDMLSRIVFYAMTRRTIYDTLVSRATVGEAAALTPQTR
jgi:hypothetical protein